MKSIVNDHGNADTDALIDNLFTTTLRDVLKSPDAPDKLHQSVMQAMRTRPGMDEVFGTTLEKMMNDAQIPAKLHFRVVKALHTTIKSHAEANKKHEEFIKELEKKHEEQRQRFDEELGKHQEQREQYMKVLDAHVKEVRRLETIKEGKPGRDGQDAISIPGLPGRDGAMGMSGKDAEPVNENKIIEAIMALIKKRQIFDIGHIKGLQTFLFNGIKYKFEELMSGAGGNSGGSSTKSTDLSAQCTGSNLVFTIPSFTTGISLIGTDAPIVYRPGVDYVASGLVLTLSGVNPPSSGATLIWTYA